MGQRGNHLLKQSKFATRSGPTPPNLIHPPQLKPLLLHSSSVNKTNLRAVINAADPVQRRCIPAQATVQQAGRQAGPGLGRPLHSHIITPTHRDPHHCFNPRLKTRAKQILARQLVSPIDSTVCVLGLFYWVLLLRLASTDPGRTTSMCGLKPF